MKPSHLAAFLMAAIPERRPVLIVGGPGVGKTQIIEQVVHKLGADLIQSHPAVEDPTVVGGFPFPNGKEAHFLPFGNMALALRAKTLTVWDLEDLGQATAAMQAAYMQLILAGRVGEHVLPDCVTFVASTNRRIDRAGVTGILEPVKSRFASIVTLEPDLNEWCQWAYRPDVNMPPELIAYHRFKKDALYQFEPTADLTNSPTPRTWENLGRIQQLNLPKAIEFEAMIGAVGEGQATQYTAFRNLLNSLPDIDAILIDPDNAKIPKEPSQLWAVTSALAMKANGTTFDRIARYAQRMVDGGHAEFATFLLRDSLNRDRDNIERTAGFIQLMTTELGQLITGGEA